MHTYMSRTQPQRAPQVRTPTPAASGQQKRIPGPGPPDVATHSTRSLDARQAHTHPSHQFAQCAYMMYSHVVRRTRIDPDTTSNSTCTYYTTCTYVYAPDPWAVAGSLWQIYFQCMIKPRPKSLLRSTSLENWHSISDWCSVKLSFYPGRSLTSAITIAATVSLSKTISPNRGPCSRV